MRSLTFSTARLCTALWIALLAASVTPFASAEPDLTEHPSTVEAVRAILDADERQVRRCIPRANQHIEALDDQHVLFRRMRNELWIVQLRDRCPNLDRADRLVLLNTRDLHYCRSDRIEGRDGLMITGLCRLGNFERISAEELAQIEAVIRGAGH
jgi:hypothetical protein